MRCVRARARSRNSRVAKQQDNGRDTRMRQYDKALAVDDLGEISIFEVRWWWVTLFVDFCRIQFSSKRRSPISDFRIGTPVYI